MSSPLGASSPTTAVPQLLLPGLLSSGNPVQLSLLGACEAPCLVEGLSASPVQLQ